MNLRAAVESLVTPGHDRHATRFFFTLCWQYASAYLQRKEKMGRLQTAIFGLSVDDLAIDCFADLFGRDEAGRCYEIHAYFESLDWDTMPDAELEVAFRRLIFSKVNEGLFRRYSESDPTLARIIRNIKLAVKSRHDLLLLSRGHEQWIATTGTPPHLFSAPLAPPTLLEAAIVSKMGVSSGVPDTLTVLITFVSDRPWYAAAYPLIGFAQVVRTAFITIEAASIPGLSDTYHLETVSDAVARAVRSVHRGKYAVYVAGGKVPLQTYNAYLDVVQANLSSDYSEAGTAHISLYQALAASLPSLTESEYRSRHRNILEYLTRCAREKLIGFFRHDLEQAASYRAGAGATASPAGAAI